MRYAAVLICSLMPVLPPACCGVGRLVPKFGPQANIIVWDQAKGVEHFVRNASFSTKDNSMGFIAPTPTVPVLSKVDEAAFTFLASLEPKPAPTAEAMTGSKSLRAGAVPEVMQQVEVAGYTATTLRASDAKGLAAWMTKNGYVTTPGIQRWTDYYIKKKWMLTAFKVSTQNGAGATGSVRMSFKTDVPFNPYYVPSENVRGPVGVKLFWLSQGDFSGSVGGQPWVSPTWSAELPDDGRNQLAGYLGLKASDMPSGMTVRAFEDRTFPTEATADVEFHEVNSARKIVWPVVGVFTLLGAGFFVRSSRISKRA